MTKLGLLCLAFAVHVAVTSANVCDLPSVHDRIDCHPDGSVTQDTCEARKCCWVPYNDDPSRDPREPGVNWCFFSAFWSNYAVTSQNETDQGIHLTLQRHNATVTGFDYPIDNLSVDITFVSDDSLRVQVKDANSKRFEVPSPTLNLVSSSKNPRKYQVSVNGTVIDIKRVETGITLFSLDLSKMIYNDQYIQLVMHSLPNSKVYGGGQHYSTNEVNFTSSYKKIRYLNSDHAPKPHQPLYGTHPFYLVKEKDGLPHSHGVLIFNNHPAEIVFQPSRKMVYRTIGGIIDVLVFLGDHPNQVIEKKNKVIGLPNMPPLWTLGFHLCRYGYQSTRHMNETMRRNLAVGIPIETQWADIDYMQDRNDFTVDKGNWSDLSQFVDEIHAEGRRFMPILDPAVSGSEPAGSYPPADLGREMDIFIRSAWNESEYAVGKVWNPETSIFPDFSNPITDNYWARMMVHLYKQIKFDGMWIDMNEPANMENGEKGKGCPTNKLNNPQFVPGLDAGWWLWKGSLCPSSNQHLGRLYDLRNMYGYFEAVRTFSAMKKIHPNKRPFILSRSSATGQGALTASWTGDVDSSWADMRQSVEDIINFNMLGVPMVGADICGFSYQADKELCNRWLSLGAFYTFSRAHNTIDAPDQDPAVMGDEVIKSAKHALAIRYKMLPYLYTQMFTAAHEGTPVIRSPSLEFADITGSTGKFLLGPSILVVPALYPDQKEVEVDLPKNTTWFNYQTAEKVVDADEKVRKVHLKAELGDIPILVKAGSIITQHRETRETISKQVNASTYELMIVLDAEQRASGQLFVDDGEQDLKDEKYSLFDLSVEPSASPKGLKFSAKVIKNNYQSPNMKVTKVNIIGLDKALDCVEQPCKVLSSSSNVSVFDDLELNLDSASQVYFKSIN